MYEPIRGGTRGGAAEFKWTDVSADKDREHYLGHSINAPTGRWQRNKDVHWYSRDAETSASERREEFRKIKEAEAEALSVALGFKPMVRSDPNAPPAPENEEQDEKAAQDLQPSEDIQKVLAEEHRKREKAERKAEKERKRAEKEQRRAAKEERRKERREREASHRYRSRDKRPYHDNRGRVYGYRERRSSLSRSRSPSPSRTHGDASLLRGRYSRSISTSLSPPRKDFGRRMPEKAMTKSISPSHRYGYPSERNGRRERYTPPPRSSPYSIRQGHSPAPKNRSPRRSDHHSERREAYRRSISPRRRMSPPYRSRYVSSTRQARSRSPRPLARG